jgi:putative hydrolase of the HAD superfamily
MIRAVIFDWYGTLAESEHAGVSSFEVALSRLGYEPDPAVIDAYHVRWDGADHRAHSTSREAYGSWTRGRLRGLAGACGAADGEVERVVDALVASEANASMLAFPEAIPTLRALRARGLLVGVCSNWGWDLSGVLEATEVAPLVDVAVTSARVGFRKPHPGIYASILGTIGVDAAEAVFVGD